MTEAQLIEAMRPGSRNPLDNREAHDLGRFGLGLKSASFSQCRRLTVLTRRDEQTSCAVWDLDDVARTNEWAITLLEDHADIPWHDRPGKSGTEARQTASVYTAGYTTTDCRAGALFPIGQRPHDAVLMKRRVGSLVN